MVVELALGGLEDLRRLNIEGRFHRFEHVFKVVEIRLIGAHILSSDNQIEGEAL